MCDRCQRNAPQLKAAVVELQPVAVEPQVWYLVGMDLIGPFQPTADGHKFVLTMTDYFSKYVEAVPIPDKTAVSVAQGIYKVYCRQGAPVSIICDQGKEFVNQVCYRPTSSYQYYSHLNIPVHYIIHPMYGNYLTYQFLFTHS